ncbi:MAG: putative collagen-binding domain-containing protein [Acidobacteriota bacterium]
MSDGSAAILYIPTTRTVTVEMSQISGPVAARWFDPANGAYIGIQGPLPNSGSRQFSTPGINAGGDTDWLLVLEATQDVTPPALSNIQFSSVGLAGGTIGWTSNEDSNFESGVWDDSGLRIGGVRFDSDEDSFHDVPGLVSHTVYHFRVSSTDASGNVSCGSGSCLHDAIRPPALIRLEADPARKLHGARTATFLVL